MAEATNSFGGALSQVLSFAGGLSTRQKLLLGAGAVLVAATLFAFVKYTAKPDMKVLYSGMDPAEAQALGARLAAKNIAYQLSPDGTTVSVAADQLDAGRMEVASQPMPRSGRLGFELFDKPSWAASDFNEKVNYQRALEGELERTIQTLSDVVSARVHLVLPPDSIFTESDRAAKASVVLKLRSGRLSLPEQAAIARLVAGSVDKLSPDNVTVVDADTNRALSTAAFPYAADGNGNTLDDLLAGRLVKTLEPVVGADRIRASVHVEYDMSSSEENQETYDPKSSVALTTQRSEERSGAGTVAGAPGTSSNMPGASAAATRNIANEAQSSSENSTFAVNRVVRHTVQPSGRVKRIATALLVDDVVTIRDENGKRAEVRSKRSLEELKQIEDLARAAIGFDANRGDVISVQNISFQPSPVETPSAPTKVERALRIVNDWASVLRLVGVLLLFLLVYLLVLRPVKRQLVSSFESHQNELPRAASEPEQVSAPARPVAREKEEVLLDLPDATPEMRRLSALTRHVAEKIKAEPLPTTKLVQTWIHEEAPK